MGDSSHILARFRDLFALDQKQADEILGQGGYSYYKEYFSGLVPLESYIEKVRLIARLSGAKGKSLLDVGCGHGTTACLLEANGASKVTGLELNAAKTEACKRVSSFLGCEHTNFVCYPGGTMPFDDESFDVVITNAALSHVYDIDAVLLDMRRVLKPGGTLYVFEDNNAMRRGYNAIMSPRWHFAETGEGSDEVKRAHGDWTPYVERRRRMIAEWHPDLSTEKVDEIARATKGLALDDLRKTVGDHVNSGTPIAVNKPFRYYAPDTGEAMEYPFTPPMLREMVARHFDDARIHSAWTGPWRGLKGAVKLTLKTLSRVIPPVLYYTHPVYAVTAKKARA